MLKLNFKAVNNFILLIFLLVNFASCVSRQDIIYFQNDKIINKKSLINYNTTIKPDDVLQIVISALDVESARPFNLSPQRSQNVNFAGQQIQGYLVDNLGEIDFPVLGKLKVGGLTRYEVIEMLKNRLSPDYLKNPNINFRIINFKINVLGSVKRPGSYNIQSERISVLDAIALAGDLTISGQRKGVIVIREENGIKTEYKLDLRSKKTFKSPVYYLQQNDVVYVTPNYASIQSASSNTNTRLFFSITSLLIAIITLIIRL